MKTLVLVNSRGREVFRAEEEKKYPDTYSVLHDGGDSGRGHFLPRRDMLLSAAHALLDAPSAKASGELAEEFARFCKRHALFRKLV